MIYDLHVHYKDLPSSTVVDYAPWRQPLASETAEKKVGSCQCQAQDRACDLLNKRHFQAECYQQAVANLTSCYGQSKVCSLFDKLGISQAEALL